jgi:hypothetical protein
VKAAHSTRVLLKNAPNANKDINLTSSENVFPKISSAPPPVLKAVIGMENSKHTNVFEMTQSWIEEELKNYNIKKM